MPEDDKKSSWARANDSMEGIRNLRPDATTVARKLLKESLDGVKNLRPTEPVKPTTQTTASTTQKK
jgi:hypothetical protein